MTDDMAKHFFRTLSFLALTLFLMTACSSGSDDSTPIVPTTGTITVSQSGSTATPQNPAKSSAGTPAAVTLSQKSSYNDPDGSVYTCEPKATVTLTTKESQVKAKSFAELTTIQQNISQTQQGQNPVTYQTTQTFTLGGQTLTFDLSHEVYTYTTSTKQQVEMPYLKLSAAKNGEAKTETRSTSGAEIAVTGIRLIPVATRGSYTTEQAYEVRVSFAVDATAMNASTPQSQTLSFEASYDAIVETTTEYADPQTTFSYTLYTQGTASTQSPFTMDDQAQQMTTAWEQVAQYTYFSLDELATKVVTREPKANVTLVASKDTLWATDKEQLEKLVATDAVITQEGTSPLVTKGQKTFSIAGKDISLNWSYETYDNVNAEGTDVAMPHLELSEPQIVSAKATELPNVTIPGKAAKVYEVEIRLSQELKSVDAPESKSETIEYIVKCIGVIEVKLAKVVYRKDWEWVDSHDNILLAYYPMVHRDRIYSTGETFTDTFRDYGHLASSHMAFSIGGEPVQTVSDGTLVRTMWPDDYRDSIHIRSFSASVPNLSKVFDVYAYEGDIPEYRYITPLPGAWDEYIMDKTYENLDISLEGVEVTGANSSSSKPSGWYAYMPDCLYNSFVCIYNDEFRLLQGEMHILFYDQFLVIDGQMITFLEYRGPMHFSYHKDNITMPNGAPGFVYTTEFRQKFLEKNFYISRVDSIYQQKSTAPQAAAAPSVRQQNMRRSAPVWHGPSPRRSQPLRLPPPYRDLPTFEYGGDPFTPKR